MTFAHTSSRLRFLRAVVLCFAAFALPLGAVAQTAAGPVLEPTVVLSTRSTDNQRPAVASSEDGRTLICVWDGVVDGARRILMRESVDGVWLPERIVDAEPLAENRAPAVALDSAGTVHIAWLGQVRGRDRVFYAVLAAGQLVNWGPLDGGEGPDDNCGKITLRLDSAGNPWIAWEAGRGTRVTIRCARMTNGLFQTDNLTPGATNQNWFPELFFTPDPIVTWYADQIPEFALRASRFDSESETWQPVALSGLDHLPKNSLPQLLRRPSGAFLACWIEDITLEGAPRTDYVLIGEQGDGPESVPRPADFETTGTKESLARALAGDRLVLAWCSKSLTDGWQIHLASGTQLPLPEKAIITDGARSGYYDHPALAVLPGGCAVVWHSSEGDGGSGKIFYRRVRFLEATEH